VCVCTIPDRTVGALSVFSPSHTRARIYLVMRNLVYSNRHTHDIHAYVSPRVCVLIATQSVHDHCDKSEIDRVAADQRWLKHTKQRMPLTRRLQKPFPSFVTGIT
jgi:hypothetical protein